MEETLKAGVTEIQINAKNNKKAVLLLSAAIGVFVILATIFFVNNVKGRIASGYSTGMYSGDVISLFKGSDTMWGIDCKKALTSGSFVYHIDSEKAAPDKLMISSSSSEGSLTLHMEQGDYIESIDISNTGGEIEYNLDGFNEGNIKLRVSHTKAENVYFTIKW